MSLPSILSRVSLRPYNTFGLDAIAEYFSTFRSVNDLKSLLTQPTLQHAPKLFLGGGSNILLLSDVEGYVLQNKLEGIEKVHETDEHVWIKAGGGVVWHELVMFAVDANLGGMENLSLIPGTVGAAPMQNIGAYGVEIKDIFQELEALNLQTLEIEKFDLPKCRFGYRESIFKHEAKGKYVILNVTFRLGKKPQFSITYGAIQETLQSNGIETLSVKAISDAVCQIRRSKLPNPSEIGNAGSFFKNPEISTDHFATLKDTYPSIPSYPVGDTLVKVPAGWLIEQAGWKGYRHNNIGVHAKQALVLVNYGGGSGQEIKELSEQIQASVAAKFGIKLHPEVNFI